MDEDTGAVAEKVTVVRPPLEDSDNGKAMEEDGETTGEVKSVANPVDGPVASCIAIVQVTLSLCRTELTTPSTPRHESVEAVVGVPMSVKSSCTSRVSTPSFANKKMEKNCVLAPE